MSSWSSCKNCTIINDYKEKDRLCEPWKLQGGYAVQIKGCHFFLKGVCDSHTRGFLCSDCQYNKFDQ